MLLMNVSSPGWLKMRLFCLKSATLLLKLVKANRQITPAGEWLLDNFYLIEEHIHTGQEASAKGL